MDRVGILTFHCSDNFGAMLQAYGLKTYLEKKEKNVDIICYEPPFMTGRHWWIPYVPIGGLSEIIRRSWRGWRRNLKLGKSFFERRANMREFRDKYLIQSGQRKLFFTNQLKYLSYRFYIVGSDQIWNPDITLGLRKEYFGAFENKEKKKVIAYAASMGGVSLPSKYDVQFSELLKSVDCMSVRESAAIPYIRQFYEKDILTVPDPVFLLGKIDWQKVEKETGRENYVFVYMTESNGRLIDYAQKLAQRKGLMVVIIKSGTAGIDKNLIADSVAGPSEFLRYIHKADYVVTNSFHGVAFSIIFQKKFAVFQHSSVGIRISNVLELFGLENRMYSENEELDIDRTIEWNRVEQRIEENIEFADHYLMNSLQ